MSHLDSTRRRRASAALVVALVVLAGVPAPAAADTRVEPRVTVPAGETVDGDLTTAAATVVIRGTVDGDVTALAGDVRVRGRVTGDVTAFAGRVEVAGTVAGDLRAFGGVAGVGGRVGGDLDAVVVNTSVAGRVGGDTEVVGGFVAVDPGARLGGGLRTAAVVTSVEGRVGVGGSTTAADSSGTDSSAAAGSDGNADVDGASDDAVAAVPLSTLFDRGRNLAGSVDGDAALPGPLPVAALPAVPSQVSPDGVDAVRFSVLDGYRLVVTLLVGGLLLLALPRFSADVAALVAERPGSVAVAGLAVLVLAPILLVVLALSVFGLPLALAGAALLAIAAWIGSVYGRYAVGVRAVAATAGVARRVGVDVDTPRNRWLDLVVGVALVGLVVRLPVVGVALDTVVLALGLGALARLAYGAYRRHERAEAAPDVAAADGGGQSREG